MEGLRLTVCIVHITRCKFVQRIPNKTKRNRLHFLGFRWPILDFSKGYGESKQFFTFPAASSADMRQRAGSLAGLAIRSSSSAPSREGHCILDFGFREGIVVEN
jgi:hypothetical protein